MKSIKVVADLIASRRRSLGFEQKDMYMRINEATQYQRIEAGNDVKLSTLLRVLEGLDLELHIVPKGESSTFKQGVRSETRK